MHNQNGKISTLHKVRRKLNPAELSSLTKMSKILMKGITNIHPKVKFKIKIIGRKSKSKIYPNISSGKYPKYFSQST